MRSKFIVLAVLAVIIFSLPAFAAGIERIDRPSLALGVVTFDKTGIAVVTFDPAAANVTDAYRIEVATYVTGVSLAEQGAAHFTLVGPAGATAIWKVMPIPVESDASQFGRRRAMRAVRGCDVGFSYMPELYFDCNKNDIVDSFQSVGDCVTGPNTVTTIAHCGEDLCATASTFYLNARGTPLVTRALAVKDTTGNMVLDAHPGCATE